MISTATMYTIKKAGLTVILIVLSQLAAAQLPDTIIYMDLDTKFTENNNKLKLTFKDSERTEYLISEEANQVCKKFVKPCPRADSTNKAAWSFELMRNEDVSYLIINGPRNSELSIKNQDDRLLIEDIKELESEDGQSWQVPINVNTGSLSTTLGVEPVVIKPENGCYIKVSCK